MLEQVVSMFDDYENMLKKLKKKSYEERMKGFREKYGHYFTEMTAYVENAVKGLGEEAEESAMAEKKNAACMEIADTFIKAVQEKFQVNGKMKGRTQADLNFFMIYYVFPAILLTEHESAKEIADAICNLWGASFKDSKIGYTTYDSLYGAFREKIFGIF